ncbi:unnamed protein product [Calypogeia fissa]
MEHGGDICIGRFLVGVLIISSAIGASEAGVCTPHNEASLLNLKSGLIDTTGQLTNWKAGTNCCYWKYIGCVSDRNNTIVGLDLRFVAVDHSKPGLWAAAIANITTWDALFFIDFDISGPFPVEFLHLPYLTGYYFDNCNLTGTIPKELASQTALTGLSITNQPGMTGPIPEELCNLSGLLELNIASVAVTSVPDCFDKPPNLSFLFIVDTLISGPIPPSIARMKNLGNLQLQQNHFYGPIPDLTSGLKGTLEYIDLSNNQLTGPFPASMAQSIPLQWVNLTSNRLEGPLPDLSQLTYLRELRLSGNLFSGSLPSSVGALPKLQVLELDNNMLSGSIPPGFSNFCNLEGAKEAQMCNISLSGNQLTGKIPVQFFNVYSPNASFDISYNHLSGFVPRLIGPRIVRLIASHNYLFGGFALELTAIQYVDLSHNHLTKAGQIGYFPKKGHAITDLLLANNGLKGPFPQWLFLLNDTLAGLDISSNYFAGPLPDFYHDFPFLRRLNVSHNFFSGGPPKLHP